jgi:hypothetical protein
LTTQARNNLVAIAHLKKTQCISQKNSPQPKPKIILYTIAYSKVAQSISPRISTRQA